MKKLSNIHLSVMFCFILTGCYRSCASGDPLGLFTYCPKEIREALEHPKPLLHYWEKTGMIADVRVQDWLECGGRSDGGYTTPDRLPEEKDDFVASRRKHHQIQRCMLKKGYYYNGKCNNQVTKASPACGAP